MPHRKMSLLLISSRKMRIGSIWTPNFGHSISGQCTICNNISKKIHFQSTLMHTLIALIKPRTTSIHGLRTDFNGVQVTSKFQWAKFFLGFQGGQSGPISKIQKILIQNSGLNPQPKFHDSS